MIIVSIVDLVPGSHHSLSPDSILLIAVYHTIILTSQSAYILAAPKQSIPLKSPGKVAKNHDQRHYETNQSDLTRLARMVRSINVCYCELLSRATTISLVLYFSLCCFRALDNLIMMSFLLALTLAVTSMYSEDDGEGEETSKENGKSNGKENGTSQKHGSQELLNKFYAFRQKYTTVYAVVMLADWMQGTHMYTLYMSYGVNVSALFLTGFLSGGIFAPFLGSFVDKFGRKRSCIIYCLLEIAINVMEGYQNFTVLMLGRIMGGVSTNLLFSAFESWMTTEHRRQGFPEEWLSRTYSMCSIINGATAILAGIVAQLLEDALGHIGPFQGAVGLTTLALLMILGWNENYGEEQKGEHKKSSLVHQFVDGWSHTISDSRIWRIGLTQALSEGAMYTFVFMWVPTLLSLSPPGGLPTGCVFSSLMMSITMGGLCYPVLQGFIKSFLGPNTNSSEVCASIVYLLAAASMCVPVLWLSSLFSGTAQ